MNERRLFDLPVLILVLANLLPVIGVLHLGWDVGSVVVLYWAENLIVGGYTVLKLLIAGRLRALFPTVFFCVHYGGFCAIHGLFVLKLTGFAGLPEPAATSWPFPLQLAEQFIALARQILATAPPDFTRACLALLISHGASFLLLFVGQQEYRNQSANKLMAAPYKRVLVLHVAVIAGGFLVQQQGSPLGLLLVLVALKIALDVGLHLKSHAAMAQIANAAPGTDSRPTTHSLEEQSP